MDGVLNHAEERLQKDAVSVSVCGLNAASCRKLCGFNDIRILVNVALEWPGCSKGLR